MSRANYSEDGDDNYYWLWRSSVDRAISGKRGQAFLRDLLAALDAMPEKRLIANELEEHGEVCAIGALGKVRGYDMSAIDPENSERVARMFGIADALAREVVFMNDEGSRRPETPEQRWARMRAWVVEQIDTPEARP